MSKLLVIFFASLILTSVQGSFSYETKTFDVLIDHFNFKDDRTIALRYLINDTFKSSERSPILFYTGNEESIEMFVEITGFMWQIAPELNAIVVFAEHRYYGHSQPFGNDSMKGDNLNYLTTAQALADYAQLIQFLNPNKERPVITIGGSYAGELAYWMRMKYPHLVTGALASSAPLLKFPGMGRPCDMFNKIVTFVFRLSINNSVCVENIQKLWSVLP
jgi:lysosomal Pro-X carboxypeptidase